MAETETIQIKFTCQKCGGTVIELPDDNADDSIANCKSCGIEIGRWGDVKTAALEAARNDIIKKFKGMFKK